MTLNKQRLAMIEDSGPLQAMFEFPHDEVLILNKWLLHRVLYYSSELTDC